MTKQKHTPKKKAAANYIATDTKVAEYCGMERREFYEFKKRDGDAFPKKTKRGWNSQEVKEYFRETGRIQEKPDGAPIDYYIERARKMQADADRQELEVQRLKGELIPSGEVYASWSKQVADLDQIMKKSSAALARKVVTMTVPEAKLLIDETWREARKDMAK